MKYRAIVTQVGTKGRIKVKCPDVWDKQESPWCYPCIPFLNLAFQPKTKKNVDNDECKCSVRIPGCEHGSQLIKVNCKEKCKLKYVIRLPKVGEYVWLEFEKDDVNSTPIYVGTWGDEEFWEKIEAEP